MQYVKTLMPKLKPGVQKRIQALQDNIQQTLQESPVFNDFGDVDDEAILIISLSKWVEELEKEFKENNGLMYKFVHNNFLSDEYKK